MPTISLDNIEFNNLNNLNPNDTINSSVKPSQSFFFKWVHKKKSEDLFLIEVIQKFQEHFKLGSFTVTKRVFEHAIWTKKITWCQTQELTVEKLNQIFIAFTETLYYSGAGVTRRSQNAGESINQQTEIIDFLLARHHNVPAANIWANAKSLLLKKDPNFFAKFQKELQNVLNDAYEQTSNAQVSSAIMEIFVGNVLCLLPYTYPEKGKSFEIPVFEGGSWKKVKYVIDEKISLTPQWYSSPLPAYGMISEEGPPIMVFQGSTFPAGDGFWAAIMSDFCFGLPVGRLPTLLGRKPLHDWIQGKNNIHAYGVSLGGSTALNVAKEFEENFACINAFNPFGFYPWNNRRMETHVNIYSQWEDLVSNAGLLPEGPNVKVFRCMLNFDENFVMSHNRGYSGADNVTFIKSLPEYENQRSSRVLLTILHIISPIFFLPLFIIHALYSLFAHLIEFFTTLFDKKEEQAG